MHANAAKCTHGLCVYVCNPWPTFLHLDVTPLHMPPAQHAIKLMWISWAQRKITFAVSVNTGVKGSLLWLDIAKAVLFLLLCTFFFFFYSQLFLRNRLFFFMNHGYFVVLNVSTSYNNEVSERSHLGALFVAETICFQYLVCIRKI